MRVCTRVYRKLKIEFTSSFFFCSLCYDQKCVPKVGGKLNDVVTIDNSILIENGFSVFWNQALNFITVHINAMYDIRQTCPLLGGSPLPSVLVTTISRFSLFQIHDVILVHPHQPNVEGLSENLVDLLRVVLGLAELGCVERTVAFECPRKCASEHARRESR